MNIYLVGGAVRDKLLGEPITERDWVVVGETPQAMLDLGFQQVGKDFPVFIHPESREEYALARTERKTGQGYTGFACHASTDVTLEEDLLRRDLTINAMAEDQAGNLIDPYNGHADLEAKLLRHVSPAFVEDPLRVLRVARFAARYAHLGFKIAPETLAMMRSMSQSGELTTLTPERIWLEIEKTLKAKNPQSFILALKQCGALAVIFPEIERLFGVVNPVQWHPEIDSGYHTCLALKAAVQLTEDIPTRFAVMVHDLGKALTPKNTLPRHTGHGPAGLDAIKNLCQRLRVPNQCKDLALLVAEHHISCHKSETFGAKGLLKLLQKLDPYRRKSRYEAFLTACNADFVGRVPLDEKSYYQADFMRQVLAATLKVDISAFVEQGLVGEAMATAIARARQHEITQFLAKKS